mmetsp:Transcript_27234/g.60168  ORF Transcript_27234/g.60168 Transcript_27234/m.60168 type:complete len:92 (+) Transcript_27234:999-1274(+)
MVIRPIVLLRLIGVGSFFRKQYFGTKMNSWMDRQDTKMMALPMKWEAFGLEFTSKRMGQPMKQTRTMLSSAMNMYWVSANSVDRCRAFQVW